MAHHQMTDDEEQNRIDEEINRKLDQEEEWENTYGHLMEEEEDRDKFSGGTLSGQKERMKVNRDYQGEKLPPDVDVKFKKK